MSNNCVLCKLCNEPMPNGEEMFQYHGYSGPCPKVPIPKHPKDTIESLRSALSESQARVKVLEGLLEVIQLVVDDGGFSQYSREKLNKAIASASPAQEKMK